MAALAAFLIGVGLCVSIGTVLRGILQMMK